MKDIEQLCIVAQAKYDQQRQDFAKIIQQETSLRTELRRLTHLDQSAPSGNDDLIGIRAIGADVLWRAWLGRSRTALNTELARVLARKALEQDRVRVAFGKLTALRTLVDESSRAQRKNRAQIGLSEAITHALNANLRS